MQYSSFLERATKKKIRVHDRTRTHDFSDTSRAHSWLSYVETHEELGILPSPSHPPLGPICQVITDAILKRSDIWNTIFNEQGPVIFFAEEPKYLKHL